MIKQREATTTQKGKPDKAILFFTGFMTLFGIIMIFNASVYIAAQVFNDQFYFLKLQAIWTVIGITIGTIVYFVGYQRIIKIILLLLLSNIVLLILVLIFGQESIQLFRNGIRTSMQLCLERIYK